ncbi:hypothetical protein EPUS_02187 [Endocarpon pusillum Z07020]|uniref:Poly(A) RNA polymerase mitochondrial-like central palm domain-containing protein n=1 Tax=Endocarpon pusillum (strain Z07020 / HMAS-L-300199) TaxID=1263415 RepID=U1HPI1_ENDPU|nr:uncharacterized protein EPUS_02187 [Endocarpon pusillum Z07020]ERF72300.1 hypothetical protein EPUS_02187 [Endocarpon pusillum Z07020]
MPPVELPAAGTRQFWVELRRQWRLPFAILASNDSCLLPQSSATYPYFLKHWSSHRSSHSSVQSSPSSIKAEPWVVPESLSATLEAHRDANRAPPIRKTARTVKSGREAARLVLALRQKKEEKKLKDEATHAARGREEEPAQDPDGGLGTEHKNKPKGNNSVEIEYQAFSQMPKKEWKLPKSDIPLRGKRPWMAHLDPVGKSTRYVYDYLTAEILAFERYMEPTASEKAAVEKALIDVRRSIEAVDPAIKTFVIGSRGTGLAMALSDIDLNLQHPNVVGIGAKGAPVLCYSDPLVRKQVIGLLGQVRRSVRKRGGPKPAFDKTALIEAKVPIVTAQHNKTGLDVQIQCTTDSFVSMELVKDYMQEYPTLRPLFLVLRQVLKMRGLGDPRSYGIGSYPLIIMIVAALRFSSLRFDRLDAGRQLLYFFDFYSKIDCRTTGISVEPAELFSKLSASNQTRLSSRQHLIRDITIDNIATTGADETYIDPTINRKRIELVDPQRPYLMCLQDPANAVNDLGRQVVAIQHVRATFATLTKKMKVSMELFNPSVNHNATFSILDPCLAANYDCFEQRRKRLQEVGRTLTVSPVVAEYL